MTMDIFPVSWQQYQLWVTIIAAFKFVYTNTTVVPLVEQELPSLPEHTELVLGFEDFLLL